MNAIRLAFLAVLSIAAGMAQTPGEPPAEWNERGLAAATRGEHAEAIQLYEHAIEGWKAKGPAYDAHLAVTLMNLGQSSCTLGKRREGAGIFEDSLAKLRRTLGVRNEWTIEAMNLLAATYLILREEPRAEALFQEALPLERELLPGSVQLARTLQGLATIHLNHSKLDAAQAEAEEALRIALASEDETSLDTAMAYATTAEVHRVARRYDRALPLYRKSRALYAKIYGPEHARVASLLSQEGLILMTEGKYGLAEKQMVQSLEMVKKTCPECTYELWVAECNLGLLRFRQKKYAEANQLLSHALEIQEKYTTKPGSDMIGTIRVLAATREKLRLFEDAARLNQRATLLMSYH